MWPFLWRRYDNHGSVEDHVSTNFELPFVWDLVRIVIVCSWIFTGLIKIYIYQARIVCCYVSWFSFSVLSAHHPSSKTCKLSNSLVITQPNIQEWSQGFFVCSTIKVIFCSGHRIESYERIQIESCFLNHSRLMAVIIQTKLQPILREVAISAVNTAAACVLYNGCLLFCNIVKPEELSRIYRTWVDIW